MTSVVRSLYIGRMSTGSPIAPDQSSEAPLLARMSAQRAGPYDRPTARELLLFAAAVVFAPVAILFAGVWIARSEQFKNLRGWRKGLLIALLPLLMPVVYCTVVVKDMAVPLGRRIAARWRAMREARRAVNDLLER